MYRSIEHLCGRLNYCLTLTNCSSNNFIQEVKEWKNIELQSLFLLLGGVEHLELAHKLQFTVQVLLFY